MVPEQVVVDGVGQVGEHAAEAVERGLASLERDRGRARAAPQIVTRGGGGRGGDIGVHGFHPDRGQPGERPLALVVVPHHARDLDQPLGHHVPIGRHLLVHLGPGHDLAAPVEPAGLAHVRT